MPGSMSGVFKAPDGHIMSQLFPLSFLASLLFSPAGISTSGSCHNSLRLIISEKCPRELAFPHWMSFKSGEITTLHGAFPGSYQTGRDSDSSLGMGPFETPQTQSSLSTGGDAAGYHGYHRLMGAGQSECHEALCCYWDSDVFLKYSIASAG